MGPAAKLMIVHEDHYKSSIARITGLHNLTDAERSVMVFLLLDVAERMLILCALGLGYGRVSGSEHIEGCRRENEL
jgi:hypothetical protein